MYNLIWIVLGTSLSQSDKNMFDSFWTLLRAQLLAHVCPRSTCLPAQNGIGSLMALPYGFVPGFVPSHGSTRFALRICGLCQKGPSYPLLCVEFMLENNKFHVVVDPPKGEDSFDPSKLFTMWRALS